MATKPFQYNQPAVLAPEPETAERSFIESLRAPVAFFDCAGKMRYMNPAAQRLLGDGLSARLEAHLQTRPDKAKVSQVKFRLPDGSERILRLELSHAQWMGEPGYQAFMDDVTPYLTAIQELQQKAQSAAGPADLAAEVQREMGERVKLQEAYQQARLELDRLKTLLQEMEPQRDKLQATLKEHEELLARVSGDLEEEIARGEQGRQEADRLHHAAAAAARQEIEALLAENVRMQLEAEAREREIAELRQALEKMEAERDSLEARLSQSAGDPAAARNLREDPAPQERAPEDAAGPAPDPPGASSIALHGKYVLAHARKKASDAVEDERRKTESEAVAQELARQEVAPARKETADAGEGARGKIETANAAPTA